MLSKFGCKSGNTLSGLVHVRQFNPCPVQGCVWRHRDAQVLPHEGSPICVIWDAVAA